METLIVDRADGVVTVTLNRPEKKNAINGPMWRELIEVFDEVADTPSDRVLVITGAGDGFCSGADLSPGNNPDLEVDAGGVGSTFPQMRPVRPAALRLPYPSPPSTLLARGGGPRARPRGWAGAGARGSGARGRGGRSARRAGAGAGAASRQRRAPRSGGEGRAAPGAPPPPRRCSTQPCRSSA